MRKTTWRDDLIARYPAMFGHATDSRSGFPEVGDGWCDLLDTAFGRIADVLRERPGTSFKVDQVKEKFGVMRLYSHGSYLEDEEVRQRIELAVDLARARSACTCETCGAEGRLYDRGGWLATACAEHAEGDPVRIKPGRENLFVVHTLRNGEYRLVTCRRYLRDNDAFVDIDPASIGIKE